MKKSIKLKLLLTSFSLPLLSFISCGENVIQKSDNQAKSNENNLNSTNKTPTINPIASTVQTVEKTGDPNSPVVDSSENYTSTTAENSNQQKEDEIQKNDNLKENNVQAPQEIKSDSQEKREESTFIKPVPKLTREQHINNLKLLEKMSENSKNKVNKPAERNYLNTQGQNRVVNWSQESDKSLTYTINDEGFENLQLTFSEPKFKDGWLIYKAFIKSENNKILNPNQSFELILVEVNEDGSPKNENEPTILLIGKSKFIEKTTITEQGEEKVVPEHYEFNFKLPSTYNGNTKLVINHLKIKNNN
ncbi:hypothetical protein [Mesomycoplasma lagogenitalium]|uniref:Lipoprotein n=1 Tax=Mesomycoplasma lagogenitalium TaxID=171286 RepID=A0ABY8LXE8_9BACT|nr:hypothetical protein [Mesomycoplasma lagogenitalium]WGI37008.1 hypothetical protein QEG99_01840 [Mesomycoplasma lagogenitalium]